MEIREWKSAEEFEANNRFVLSDAQSKELELARKYGTKIVSQIETYVIGRYLIGLKMVQPPMKRSGVNPEFEKRETLEKITGSY